MTTATGLPQRGDRLRDPSDNVWEVIKRFGNGLDHSLLLKPLTKLSAEHELIRRRWQLYGDPDGTMRLLEAAYWVGHGWRVVGDAPPPPRDRQPDWWFGMPCWNGLSEEQQTRLIEWGNLPIGYRPEGTCERGAEVAVECEGDKAPGPRFYCLQCAVAHLSGLWKARHG